MAISLGFDIEILNTTRLRELKFRYILVGSREGKASR